MAVSGFLLSQTKHDRWFPMSAHKDLSCAYSLDPNKKSYILLITNDCMLICLA